MIGFASCLQRYARILPTGKVCVPAQSAGCGRRMSKSTEQSVGTVALECHHRRGRCLPCAVLEAVHGCFASVFGRSYCQHVGCAITRTRENGQRSSFEGALEKCDSWRSFNRRPFCTATASDGPAPKLVTGAPDTRPAVIEQRPSESCSHVLPSTLVSVDAVGYVR